MNAEPTPTPTQTDIDYLRAKRTDPVIIQKSDAHFGDGSSAMYLVEEDQKQGTPNERDIEYLRANPEMAEKFDAHFWGGGCGLLPYPPTGTRTGTSEGGGSTGESLQR